MPRILTRKPGQCSACGSRVAKGEYADFTSATGLVHLECVGQEIAHRANTYRAACANCGRTLAPGEGLLELDEHQVEDGWRKQWRVRCRAGC
jgi:ribosomal protein L24E